MRIRVLAGVLAILILALGACGGGGDAPEPTATSAPAAASAQEVLASINVTMHDIYYGDSNDNIANPPQWTVQSGQQITLELDNQGGLEHSWAIIKPGDEVPLPFLLGDHEDLILWTSAIVAAGQQSSETFTAPEPGEYTVICTVAGHFPAMQGKLIVQ